MKNFSTLALVVFGLLSISAFAMTLQGDAKGDRHRRPASDAATEKCAKQQLDCKRVCDDQPVHEDGANCYRECDRALEACKKAPVIPPSGEPPVSGE